MTAIERSKCAYQQYYCEENIYKLCEHVSQQYPKRLDHCYVVFISNPAQMIPLWSQRIGGEDGAVVWDYHVVLIDICGCDDAKSGDVYDFDTTLPFPTSIEMFARDVLRSNETLRHNYRRLLRLLPASVYLTLFSSDRRHMRDATGAWLKPPPDWPVIFNETTGHNLQQLYKFPSSQPIDSQSGVEVIDADQLIDWCIQQRT